MKKVRQKDIEFYFDAKSKDSYDNGTLSMRSARFLAIREKLMKLSPEVFDSTMTQLEATLQAVSIPSLRNQARPEAAQGSALFERIEESRSTSSDAASSAIRALGSVS